jgi:hypothetical protein
VVGHEDHPGALVQPGGFERVQDLADGGVGDGDGSVEVGEVLTHVVRVGQVVGQRDAIRVRGGVPLVGVRPVRLEESCGQQERLGRRGHQPVDGLLDDVLAERVADVVLVETEPRRVRSLVLHAEEGCVPT